jgi:hypothetical protein
MSEYGYGRDAAIKHRWIQLKTAPEQYRPIFGKIRTDLTHCELCGMAISYAFPLAHKSDPNFKKGKSLWIGQDCVRNYFLHKLPMNLVEEMIANMTRLIEEEKRARFKLKHPRFEGMLARVQEDIAKLKREFSGCYDVLSGKRRLMRLIVLEKAATEFSYNGYVSDNRVLAVKAVRMMIKKDELSSRLRNHWALKLKKIKIANDQKTRANRNFYSKFIASARDLGWGCQPDMPGSALSELEKEAFSEQLSALTEKTAKTRDRDDAVASA